MRSPALNMPPAIGSSSPAQHSEPSTDPDLVRLCRLAVKLVAAQASSIVLGKPPSAMRIAQYLVGGFDRQDHQWSSYYQQVLATGEALMFGSDTPLPAPPSEAAVTYLGVPIRMRAGAIIGVLSVIDANDRQWSEADRIALEELAPSIAAEAERWEAGAAEAEEALRTERSLLVRRIGERTSELRVANAELARAARLKDEFLASMSHELRTPLNAILGLSEALQEQIYGSLSQRQIQILQAIEESGRHLLALINDILDLSKIESGKLELQLGPVVVAEVCQASLRLIQQAAHQKRLKVSSRLDNPDALVVADERRLKQILVNLLSNAVKFTPDGGQIGLEVVCSAVDDRICLSVWDTGIGIEQVDLERLFQPFVQLDSSLARPYSGTGLGLALVSRMVRLHGGSIEVESAVGRGSRFSINLPWRREECVSHVNELATSDWKELTEPTDSFADQPPVSARRAPVVILAEDNEDNITLLVDYLRSKHYEVVVARNGFEAVERAKEYRPDLILMDMQMPVMDGLEATRRIRTDADLSGTPIVALTALAMKGDRERCLEAGVDDYLSKPVRLKQLNSVIEALLSPTQVSQKVY